MSPHDAAKILELSTDATPEQLEARFLELRRKLEDKIAKAPTPGLQAKYRESLAEITTAFETLTLATDSSTLPMLQRQGTRSDVSGASSSAAVNVPPPPREPSRPAAKKSSKEFFLVAVIAVVVLGAGGWWVMKTRAENAEKVRLAAAAQAEAERKAAEAERKAAEEKRLAEEKRQAEEATKARLAAEAKAEQERLDQLAARVRVDFAEAKLLWEQAQRAEREAQREVENLRSGLRSGRDLSAGQKREIEARLAAQEDYFRWLADQLVSHPARRAGVRTEESLNSRQPEAANESLKLYQQELAALLAEITRRQPSEADLYGSLNVTSDPPGAAWEFTDAFGAVRSGRTPDTVTRVAAGTARVVFRRAGWKDESVDVQVSPRKEASASLAYRPGGLVITSNPAGAEVFLNGVSAGRTPLTLANQPNGEKSVELRLEGYKSQTENLKVNPGETSSVEATLKPLNDRELIAEWTTRMAGTWTGNVRGTVVYCEFTPGSTSYTEWPGNGKFANLRSTLELEVESREPLMLKRIRKFEGGRVTLDGRSFLVFGEFFEQGGNIVYRQRSPEGRITADAVLSRVP